MNPLKRAIRRRRRWLIITILLLIAAGFAGTLHVRTSYTSKSGRIYIARLESGALTLGWEGRRAPWSTNHWTGFSWSCVVYPFTLNTAWRPYHVAFGPWPTQSHYHSLAIPLWPVGAASIGYVLFLHGRVRGVRAASAARCHACNYDLTGLHHRAEKCPECGSAPAAHPTTPL